MEKIRTGINRLTEGFSYLETNVYKYRIILYAGGLSLSMLLPVFGFSQYMTRIFIMIGIYTMLALGLNILTGYTGLVSLGHGGFFAIGAYTTAILMLRFQMNFLIAVMIAMVFTGICGLLLGLPTLRLTGTYLSIVTLGFGEIVRMVIMNFDTVTNGTLGIRNIPRPSFFGFELTLANHGLFYLMLVLLILVTYVCIGIQNSNMGRTLRAIKADELAAVMMGIRSSRYKVGAFVVSAVLTGLAGGYYASLVSYIDHNSFTFDVSIMILSIVILGGMGTIRGMFLGAAILVAFPEVARPLMEWRFVVYGLVLILMMRFKPQGLLGWRSRLPYKIPVLKRSQTYREEKEANRRGR
ncbi:branched-chain amino acid ABC transporter permease [Mobilitalea sibirica]|uniref:Branched-chain amino acid ABC transporter permease n=1 Tax=Mobilitalea sibirica TaxID=1462919 RepID=A0A8J7H660_9FIRM|nr:branched-chain amino acid ABC transporter permease [Mobilitalea sibirica]MBH1942179.1 branched-chain amino acid ABC transporter permease [Mobilitalea sibirica]